MDVFSLLKFWRNAGIGDPINPSDFDIIDDEGSFFDLVFTHPDNIDSTLVTDLKSNKRKILPLDISNNSTTKNTPKSPFRSLLGLQNNKVVKPNKEMKCEIEQVTISSLLGRDNSLRHKLKTEKLLDEHMTSKRFSKDVVNKYLNLIKPKGLKRGNDKVRCSEQSHQFMFSPRKDEKKVTVFKEVRKHLGKSRSSSSNAGKPVALTALRRDDSALQQQDGIQSAILHCKKSYNSPSQGCNVLSRSGSAPSHGSRISVDEEKRSSI
nr:probable membrane-associated kinase regulator 2 [Tanacetum cinerariifolium]